MNKRTNRELLPVRIIIAVAIVAIFAASLFLYFGQESVAVQNAKEAYEQYLKENPSSKETDFIYIEAEGTIVAIRNGSVINKEFKTEAAAVKAATDNASTLSYTLSSTNSDKLYSVKLFDPNSSIFAVGAQKLAAGAVSMSVKVVSGGTIFAEFDIPAGAIANKQEPVEITISKIDPKANVSLGKNQEGFAYDIDVTNLAEGNTAEIGVTINGPKGLAQGEQAITVYHNSSRISSKYNPTSGQISFKTTSFSPYTFTYDVVEVTTLEELREQLSKKGGVNIRLAAPITIDMEEVREGAKGEYGDGYLYFGALVFGDKTIDLNGQTITYSGSRDENDSALFCVNNNASLTIVDSSNSGNGRVEVKFDTYAVWSVNPSSRVNIYDGIFVSDKYAGFTADTNAALVYSSGGKINVYGGYYLFDSANGGERNGFNVIDQAGTETYIWIYEGVHLSSADYCDAGDKDVRVVRVGEAEIVTGESTREIGTEAGAVAAWHTVKGQKIELDKTLNTDKYIYRVGNRNGFPLGAFFNQINAPTGSVSVRVVDILATKAHNEQVGKDYDKNDRFSGYYENIGDQYVNVTYKAGNTWDTSTVQIASSFTGPVKLEIVNGDGVVYASVNLEVVDGKNMTTSVISPSSSNMNVCLLNNIETGSTISINNGYAFYGNGFTIKDTRTTTAQSAGLMIVYDGTVDNIKLDGYQSTTNSATISENGRAPAMSINGPANVYNSYIQGGRQAILCNTTGNVYLKNVTLDGGSRANMEIMGGNVILEDCTTTVDTTGGLKGMGILVASTSVKLTIDGSLTQYNWVKSADLPTAYGVVLSSLFNDSTYSYNSHLNMGIFFMVESVVFTEEQVRTQLVDNTGNDYGYVQKTESGYTATAYIPKKSLGPSTFYADPTQTPAYQGMGNHAIVPDSTFDFTTKNYDAKETDDNIYCFYNSIGYVDISFETGGSKIWDTNILTAVKFGKNLPVSVSMNGTDYTGKSIEFTEAGEYELTFTCVDPYNYTAEGVSYNLYYAQKLKIKVAVVEPEAIVYHPEFIYTDGSSTTQVIANNKTYVMPDVSATSSTIGSTTVGGKTIYYPIVSVGGSGSSGGSYSSGKIYCWSPAFTAINIKDYNKDTGELLYTYDKSMQKWPHNISSTTKVTQGEYFGYGSTNPYTGNTGDSYNVCKYSSTYGLSFVATEIERNVTATSKLVEFYYVGNDGITYYYYIKYEQKAVTYSGGCVTPDTLITLANGTQVRVDSLTGNEQLLVWNLKTGKYEAAPIVFVDSEAAEECTVVHLYFSDGSDVKVLYEHGFFDLDLGKYVYIDANNYADYVGHRFVTEGDISKDTWNVVTLDEVKLETEVTTAWSPVTFEHLCYYTNGVLSMPGGIEGLFNIFEVDTETMTYDAEKMAQDIAAYGLLTLEDFGGMIPQAAFDAFNGQYLNIAISKGLLTWEDIAAMAERYVPLM